MSGEMGNGHVRTRLERGTRHLHLALHADPLMSRLTSPYITVAQYQAALSVLEFGNIAVEGARSDAALWPALSLRSSCTALAIDRRKAHRITACFELKGAQRILGGLYVMHGAAFGRQVFGANVRAVLPAAPTRYITLPAPVTAWRVLCKLLEETDPIPGAFEDILAGARTTFEAIAKAAQRTRATVEPTEAGKAGGCDRRGRWVGSVDDEGL